MSAQVLMNLLKELGKRDKIRGLLLNLLNSLRKRDKMRDLRSILSLFRNEFNKSNNTRA